MIGNSNDQNNSTTNFPISGNLTFQPSNAQLSTQTQTQTSNQNQVQIHAPEAEQSFSLNQSLEQNRRSQNKELFEKHRDSNIYANLRKNIIEQGNSFIEDDFYISNHERFDPLGDDIRWLDGKSTQRNNIPKKDELFIKKKNDSSNLKQFQ